MKYTPPTPLLETIVFMEAPTHGYSRYEYGRTMATPGTSTEGPTYGYSMYEYGKAGRIHTDSKLTHIKMQLVCLTAALVSQAVAFGPSPPGPPNPASW
jgi:hypothetical protein